MEGDRILRCVKSVNRDAADLITSIQVCGLSLVRSQYEQLHHLTAIPLALTGIPRTSTMWRGSRHKRRKVRKVFPQTPEGVHRPAQGS